MGKNNEIPNDEFPECSSPPCFLHEVDPTYSGLGEPARKDKAEPRETAGSSKKRPADQREPPKSTAKK